ncbi:hypothetical protein [uncultured Dubosiella sp.]|uniref:hypothetical protein n=1 Tax=uncultured Dubosiella sp. TaxID=1937011 RepID=UPI00207DC1D4|nr:hypothetical protein [uncultured Dubosiella sp.]GJM58013.1 hypothetical protein EROP_17060 [Erysipelotrichaceae bacterium OPF54]
MGLLLIDEIIPLFLIMAHITLPELMMVTISKIAGLIGPLGMIMIARLLAGIDLKKVFTQKRIYQITILKMVVVPLLVLGLLFVLSRFGIDEDQKMILWIVFLAVITPSAAMVSQLAQLHDNEPSYASAINGMTTIISIFFMPIMTEIFMQII